MVAMVTVRPAAKLTAWGALALGVACGSTAEDGDDDANSMGGAGGGAAGSAGMAGNGAAIGGYDLRSYSGDASGLCPAETAYCGTGGQAVTYACLPDASTCCRVDGCQRSVTNCGWTVCPSGSSPDCEGIETPSKYPCVSDDNCAWRDMVCNTRIGDVMFCGAS